MKQLVFIITIFCTYLGLHGQVKFEYNRLNDALAQAKVENKSVFVEFYAPWCIPCKKMEKHFRDKTVGKVYNQNFINVRINVDEPQNEAVKLKYQVVFLPMLMVLDQKGEVRYQVDKALDKKGLLEIANLTADPNLYYASEATRIQSSPVANGKATSGSFKKEDVTPEKGEKILAVIDINSEMLPPEVMYQEAYDRLARMDLSYRKMVNNYLASQPQWSELKNLKFIHDFVDATLPDLADYYLSNLDLFVQAVSKNEVNQTKYTLIHQELYQVIPRPDWEETKRLFSLLEEKDADKKAHQYYLDRLFLYPDKAAYKKHVKMYLQHYHDSEEQQRYQALNNQ